MTNHEQVSLFGDDSIFDPFATAFAAPPPDPSGIELAVKPRPYQIECEEAVFQSWEDGNRKVLVVKATGLGKTNVFCSIALKWIDANPGKRVLILAHRKELVSQAVERLEQMSGGLCRLGREIGIEQGQLMSSRHTRIVVGMVQSIWREDRIQRLRAQGGFDLIIIDEAHHVARSNKTYMAPLEAFPEAKVLGVTATPDRGDEKALGSVFDDVAFVYDILDGINEGWLVPLDCSEEIVEQIDLDTVGLVGGDFNQGQLDNEMAKAMDGCIERLIEKVPFGTDQGIVFCPGVHSAHFAAARLNKIHPGSAIVIDGSTDPDERAFMVKDFRKGKVQWLVNCMVATEGFDAPNAAVIAILRPTKSRALFAQMCGRGTRALPGVVDDHDTAEGRTAAIARSGKPACRILNFEGKNTKHKLITPIDILGGNYDDEVIEKAKEMAKEARGPRGEQGDPRAYLEAAKRELVKLAEARKRAQIHARSRAFNPFSIAGVDEDAHRAYVSRFGAKSATPKQIEVLKNAGFPENRLRSLSQDAAKQLFKHLAHRRKAGLATMKQLKVLSQFGVFESKIPFQNANDAITYIAQNGWGRKGQIDQSRLHKILGVHES